MKKRNFLFGALVALAMAGCSDNELEKDNGFVVPEDGVVYTKISVAMPSSGIGGRAFGTGDGEFDPGTDGTEGTVDENSIKKLVFVFYNRGGLVLAQTTIEGEELENMKTQNGQTVSGDNKCMFQGVVAVKLDRTVSVMPAYVMAFANPQSESEGDLRSSLSDVRASIRPDYKSKDGFTMNNSVYYDNNSKLVVATPVSDTAFKERKEEAAAATSTTKIYLERMAVKVRVKKGEKLVNTPYPVAGGRYLKFDIDNATWGLSGTEKHMFLVKNLPSAKPETEEWSWAFPESSYRSYWARSYSYRVGTANNIAGMEGANPDAKFPKYGDDVNTPDEQKEYALHYITYEEANKEFDAIEYCKENTGAAAKYNAASSGRESFSYNKYATMTYVVIRGTYKVFANEGCTETVEEFPENGTFYYFNGALYNTEASVLAAMYKVQNLVYQDEACTKPAAESDFAFKHRDGKQSSARCDIQLKGVGTGLYYKAASTATPVPVTEENLSTVNEALAKVIPAAIKYYEGKAFFAVPIEHAKGLNNDGMAQEGTYGVVRNHSYVLTINSISGLANGVAGDEPLIPTPSEDQQYWVGADIHTLHWHVVNQSVDLK